MRDPLRKKGIRRRSLGHIDTFDAEKLQKYHRYLWRWLARNPHRHKIGWPGWQHIDGYIGNNCFACVLADRRTATTRYCAHCPVRAWNGMDPSDYGKFTTPCTMRQYGLYCMLMDSPSMRETLIQVCLEIAGLEWISDDEHNKTGA